jgi:hypothetical protein
VCRTVTTSLFTNRSRLKRTAVGLKPRDFLLLRLMKCNMALSSDLSTPAATDNGRRQRRPGPSPINNSNYEEKSLIEIDMASVALCRVRYPEMVQGHHLVLVVGVFAIVDACGLLGGRNHHRFRLWLDL